jgi:multiple sugar transport system permease protein
MNMQTSNGTGLRRRRAWSIEKKKARLGLFFTMPWIIGLLIFYAYPLISSIVYSLTTYSILSPGKYVGLRNYAKLFTNPLFWKSVSNTLYFTAISVPVNIVVALVVAMLLNRRIRGVGIYRTIFFIPVLVPVVATATVWRFLLDTQYGMFNDMLNLFGFSPLPWLTSESLSKISLVLIAAWGVGQAVIINLAGLQDIPVTYYEAAEVDGASNWRKMRHITLPLLTPVIFYNLVLGVIGALQIFTLPYALTGGEGTPVNSLLFYVMYLYSNAFGYMKMGYASAMAWILFVIILALTLVIFRSSKRWVHYQD